MKSNDAQFIICAHQVTELPSHCAWKPMKIFTHNSLFSLGYFMGSNRNHIRVSQRSMLSNFTLQDCGFGHIMAHVTFFLIKMESK